MLSIGWINFPIPLQKYILSWEEAKEVLSMILNFPADEAESAVEKAADGSLEDDTMDKYVKRRSKNKSVESNFTSCRSYIIATFSSSQQGKLVHGRLA
jgi:hypothetical protein